jgi:hypothetical protein
MLLALALIMTPTAGHPVLAGERQVAVQHGGRFLAVDGKGRLGLGARRGLFVFSPVGQGQHLIRTGGACLGVKSNGSSPLTVVATVCDAGRPGQRFRVEREKSGYAISSQGAYLQYFPSAGLIAQEIGDDPLQTTYTFVDRGPSLASISRASG